MRLEPVLHPVTSLEATSIQERKDIKKKPSGKIIDISSILKVESMSSYLRRIDICDSFHVDFPFIIDKISTYFRRGNSN